MSAYQPILYTFRETPDVLLAHAQAMSAGDEAARVDRKRNATGCVVCVFVIAVAVPLSVLVPLLALVGIPVVLAALVVMGVSASRYMKARRQDLDDRKVKAFLTLSAVLRADVPASEVVQVDLDLRPYKETPPLETSADRRARYAQEWLSAEAPLQDGSRAWLELTDRVVRKESPKRKYTKVTERMHSVARVTLRLARAHGEAAQASARLATQPAPARLVLAGVEARGRTVRATFRTPEAMRTTRHTADPEPTLGDAHTLLRGLRWVYRSLAP